MFGNIAHILQLNGYFAYLLTGKMTEDDSILGSSIYWNINTRQYWEEMLEYIGITKAQLPEIVRPGSIVGTITKAASKQFDLPENLTVNIGGSDLACGPVGTGAIRPEISRTAQDPLFARWLWRIILSWIQPGKCRVTVV